MALAVALGGLCASTWMATVVPSVRLVVGAAVTVTGRLGVSALALVGPRAPSESDATTVMANAANELRRHRSTKVNVVAISGALLCGGIAVGASGGMRSWSWS